MPCFIPTGLFEAVYGWHVLVLWGYLRLCMDGMFKSYGVV